MARRIGTIMMGLALVAGLGACSDKGLRQLQQPGNGPDEFKVLPAKPLAAPEDYSVLPTPTPGGGNLVDTNPAADASLALGASAALLNATEVPGADAALVNSAGRYGVSSNIRQTLAQEDADFRRKQARLSGFRLFPVDRYAQSYRRQALDPHKETDRFRRSGIPTVASPPAN